MDRSEIPVFKTLAHTLDILVRNETGILTFGRDQRIDAAVSDLLNK
jgi:hypothetical protein